jgi:CHAT domain-containing protein
VAPAEGEDGFFTVAEILETPVPSELVVIAACSSSQGRSFEQEGRIGFVHAFFVAGGTRVLASLWDVDDQATRVFMQEFHRRLAAGAAPALALQQTQTWMKAQAAWAHPAHWAAWQLWGPRAR